MDTKPWWESKTIVASLVATVASVAALFGVHVHMETAVDVLLSILPPLASLLAIWGRISATTVISIEKRE